MSTERERLRRWSRSGAALASMAALATSAVAGEAARRVEVRVVEVAAGRAYLTPGGEGPLRVGDTVRIAGSAYPILARNSKHAVIALGKHELQPGQRGFVLVQPLPAESFAARPVPRPLQAFAGQWRAPSLPADAQSPRYVPLGTMSDARRNRAAFRADYQRVQPLSGPGLAIDRTRLRALLHAELSSLPISLDADGFAELWRADDLAQRPQNASRPVFNLRQLELGYRGDTVQAALGRLRYASSTLGVLDGGRASAALGEDWSVGAFGGTLPNPLDGSWASDAARFGGEVNWQDPSSAARPRANLTLQGSRYLGQNDERRISGFVEAYPDFGRLGARAEISFFDAGNPWGAASSELTALGADASLRFDSLRLGASFDLRRPERSLWLAAFLPPGYFCTRSAIAGLAPTEPCLGGDARYASVLNAAWDGSSWTLDGGTTFTTSHPATIEQSTAFLHFQQRELFGVLRLDAGASASHGSWLDSAALELGAGAPLARDTADLSLYYRPSIARYGVDAQAFLEHGWGGRWWWTPAASIDLDGSCELLTGADVDVLLLQVGLSWTPRF
jgi:hypothetical protein